MASIAFTSASPLASTNSSPTVHVQTKASTASAAALKPDTVKLSIAAQAKAMHHAGQSPTAIAAALGTDVASVDGYLGVTVPRQAAAPTQAAPAKTPVTAPSEHLQPGATAPVVNGKG